MIQITPQMPILLAVEPVDFRKGIDGLARVCRQVLQSDPFCGALFIFRNRRAKAIKILACDLCEAPRYVELWRRSRRFHRSHTSFEPLELHTMQAPLEGLQPRQQG